MFRGLNRDGIKAASIYIACRMHGSPRTAHEIAEIFCLDRASATSGCSMALTILNNIDRGKSDMAGKELCKTTPVLFVERFCSRLHVNTELTRLTKFIAQKIEREGLIDDNTPHAVAAGIIFFVSEHCHLRLTKVDIKRISGVSEVTINKCFKKLNGHLDQLIPRVILMSYS
jgi:transcription initiation factor TFIIB